MATMHPTDIENYSYTATEKEMYLALKEQLPEKIHVFYSIRWFDKDEGQNRVDSECDFLIFDPSFGFITLEVKGGFNIDIQNDAWILYEYDENMQPSNRVLRQSPYKQAEQSMRHFHDYFVEEFNQKFNGVYGSAVAFPRYVVNERVAQEGPLELTIDLDDMKNLAQKVNSIFHYWKAQRNIRTPFSPEQKSRFLSIVNKQISLAAAAGALIEIKQKEFSKIDFVQDSILDVLYHYKQVRLIGGAGTGKTYIAIKKARRELIEGNKTLFLCCNKELVRFVAKKIGQDDLFECKTYEDLMLEILGQSYNDLQTNENGNRCCFDAIMAKSGLPKYDAIIIDEAQDFDDDMGLSVRALLKNDKTSTLYVFYDKNQNVFSVKFENAFAIETPPFVLRYNIRNTGCIYACAVERTHLGSETVANSLLGVEPEITTYSNPTQTLRSLSGIINRLVQKEHVKTQSIVVLIDEPYQRSILNTEQRIGAFDISFADLTNISDSQISVKTIEEFKGLEADVVIYLRSDYKNVPMSERRICKEYVALTRARYYLYILNTVRQQN